MSIDLLALFVRDGGPVFPTGWPYFADGVALKLRDDGLFRPIFVIEKTAINSPVKHVFIKGSIADKELVNKVFAKYKPSIVVNLAAQAGVRYSIDHPDTYIESNLIGFYNILEACRHNSVEHLVYASSSSVYGGNKKVPFSVDDKVDNPVSLYAATKKSNELLAHSYSKLYNIPSTGLRFFTVYGPAGRPDMFYYSATQKLVAGKTIQIFNYGNCKRDFTYVDDIIEGVVRVMQGAPEKKNGEDGLPLP
nr:NAD-dependent epimerase/dehydratase family protein [Clostridiales bacterium]